MTEKMIPVRLYNMDETSLSTVQDGHWAKKNSRALRKEASQERGQSSTGVVCVNAAINYIPSMVIYINGK